jgi:triosephosphate isomerase
VAERKPLISGNWKMNLNHLEAIQAVQKLHYRLEAADHKAVEVSVHPPFTNLRSIQTLIDADNIPIALGAQNCYWEPKGAFTGEVSAPMLAKLNVTYCIVGHSERREVFGETDDDVRRKLEAVWAAGMTPILCVGETDEEREAGGTEDKVTGQVKAALSDASAERVAGMVVAYEPIWAIGTGKTATPEDAQSTIGLIRKVVGELHGEGTAESVRIQYGGSTKPSNIAQIMAQPDVDGALVGGASLDPDEFAQMVQYRKSSSR